MNLAILIILNILCLKWSVFFVFFVFWESVITYDYGIYNALCGQEIFLITNLSLFLKKVPVANKHNLLKVNDTESPTPKEVCFFLGFRVTSIC